MSRFLIGLSLAALPLTRAPAQSLELLGEQGAAKTLAKAGPLRVVLPGDEHRARWIRMVRRLRLVRVGS